MSNRVRDLEQLQEQDIDERKRKRGALAMAALAILGLAFAIGMVVGKAFEPEVATRDPLDQLDRVAEASRPNVAPQPAAAKASASKPALDPASLTFERSLTDSEERPEVLAALAAAEREEEGLAIHTGSAPPSAAPSDRDERDALRLDDSAFDTSARREPGVVPAGMVAASQKLDRVKGHDPLVAAALQRDAPGLRAGRGSDGEYTLQVVSYASRAAAEGFANALLARGHEAFITTGDVEGRGKTYRVRVGPFATREAAEEYRRMFEERERMNTIVVKRE